MCAQVGRVVDTGVIWISLSSPAALHTRDWLLGSPQGALLNYLERGCWTAATTGLLCKSVLYCRDMCLGLQREAASAHGVMFLLLAGSQAQSGRAQVTSSGPGLS